MFRVYFGAAALAAGIAMSCAYAAADEDDFDSGIVYLESNSISANTVLVYRRDAQGGLTALSPVPTGGIGTGAGLGNQGAMALSEDGGFLVAVNAGSNDFTLFAVRGAGLVPLSKTASGGSTPVSVAVHEDLIYVLNQGSDSITGFRVGRGGVVTAIEGSTRQLSATGVGAAQVAISPDGRNIVVTEKATQKIDAFSLDANGLPSATSRTITAGAATPFGFAFDGSRTLIVSQATGPAPGSSVESYRLDATGTPTPVNGAIQTGQKGACWVVISPSGRYAYSADTGTSFISGFEVGPGGALTLLASASISTGAGSKPLDEAIGGDGRFLYLLDGGNHALLTFARGPGGSLKSLGTPVAGLPAGATGLVAR